MKSLLQQLRETQAANPPPVVVPSEAAPAAGRSVGGFCRTFPSTFKHLGEVTVDFKATYWNAPSPWCRIDGQPDHPEFEANLKSI